MKQKLGLSICLFMFVMTIVPCWAQDDVTEGKKGTTVFKYKKYEQFDFEDMVVDGGAVGPGDLSIMPRFQERFKNKLPLRKNFNPELRRSVMRVR